MNVPCKILGTGKDMEIERVREKMENLPDFDRYQPNPFMMLFFGTLLFNFHVIGFQNEMVHTQCIGKINAPISSYSNSICQFGGITEALCTQWNIYFMFSLMLHCKKYCFEKINAVTWVHVWFPSLLGYLKKREEETRYLWTAMSLSSIRPDRFIAVILSGLFHWKRSTTRIKWID